MECFAHSAFNAANEPFVSAVKVSKNTRKSKHQARWQRRRGQKDAGKKAPVAVQVRVLCCFGSRRLVFVCSHLVAHLYCFFGVLLLLNPAISSEIFNTQNFRMVDRYRPLLFCDSLGRNEIVVVEQSWLKILNSLPPPILRKKYGKH